MMCGSGVESSELLRIFCHYGLKSELDNLYCADSNPPQYNTCRPVEDT